MRTSLGLICLLLLGSEKAESHESDLQASVDETIGRWIVDWDNPSFSIRHSASVQLRDAGVRAFPALVTAIQSGSAETITRALAILKTSLHSRDATANQAARKSLEQVVASSNQSAARSAKQILADYENPPLQTAGYHFGGMNGAPVGIANPIGNIAKRINTWTRNGVTTIEAFEFDRKIRIQLSTTGRVNIDITQRRLGAEITDRFESPTASDLKLKHPTAYREYQRYESTLKEARLIAQGNQRPALPGPVLPNGQIIPGGMMPGPIVPGPMVPADARNRMLQLQERQIELLQRMIATAPTPEIADTLNRNLRRAIDTRDQLKRVGQQPR